MLLLVLRLKKGIITFYVFGYVHFLTAISHFRRLYTTFGSYILISASIYYFRHYILLLALPDCNFVRIQDFLAIPRICKLKARLESKSSLLAFIQFCFFCSSVVSSINFNSHFENAVLLEILKC